MWPWGYGVHGPSAATERHRYEVWGGLIVDTGSRAGVGKALAGVLAQATAHARAAAFAQTLGRAWARAGQARGAGTRRGPGLGPWPVERALPYHMYVLCTGAARVAHGTALSSGTL